MGKCKHLASAPSGVSPADAEVTKQVCGYKVFEDDALDYNAFGQREWDGV